MNQLVPLLNQLLSIRNALHKVGAMADGFHHRNNVAAPSSLSPGLAIHGQ